MKIRVLFVAVASLASPIDEKIPSEFTGLEDVEVDLVRLFAASIKLAEYGGNALVEAHTEKKVSVLSKQSGGVAEIVTNADLESNKRMSFSFPKLFPGVHIRSEEVTDEPIDLMDMPSNDEQWTELISSQNIFSPSLQRKVAADDISIWIDPLDATREYTEDLLQYVTVMIGVAFKGEPIIGVVRKPFENSTLASFNFEEVKSVWKQTGYKNEWSKLEKLLTPTTQYGEIKTIVSRSFWIRAQLIEKYRFRNLFNAIVTPAGGAGYKVWEVVEGRQSVYVHTRKIKLWDLCAPNAIVNALGGKFVKLDGHAIDYSWTNDYLHTTGLHSTMDLNMEPPFQRV